MHADLLLMSICVRPRFHRLFEPLFVKEYPLIYALSARSLQNAVAVLRYGFDAGIICGMSSQRKITVVVSEDLLQRALDSSGKSLTGTVREGLELVAASEAYRRLRQLRGKVRFSIDLQKLREDRR
jgi:hypothetical protein